MDKSSFNNQKDFKWKYFDGGKDVSNNFFFNKVVDFWRFATLLKSTTLLKKLFYLKHLSTFPPSKHFHLKSF